MDTKYVAAFLLVAVMITRIQCGPGDDCAAMTQCMNDTGIVFQSEFNAADIGTFRQLFDIVCSKLDGLLSCFSTRHVTRCSNLQSLSQLLSTADNVRDQFTAICAQKEALVGAIECIKKITTGQTTTPCIQSLTTQNETTISCSTLSEMTKCLEMTGQCSAKAVSFLGSAFQKRLNITCSAPKMVVNVLLLCMLYMLNRFLLF